MELRFKPYPEAHSLLSRVDDDSNQLTLDLSEVEFVKPSLLFAAAAVASAHRDQHGDAPRFVLPNKGDPCVYASRMSLGEVLSDVGIGIRASLAGTQHERDDDRSAIEASVEPRVTSVRDKPRGVGLPNLLGWVTAMGGGLTIRSGRAAIEYRHQPNSTMPRATFSHVDAVDGTLVAGWVPC
ncbi:hypothetical protein [Candidatus Poriferisodalis sp.]|uniref:hypothetical protein n=1 Tax=Candidatus Poriferisodalis sp. TaxID=3101277 RepID=UPI003C6F8301